MTDDRIGDVPAVFTPKQRAQAVAKALSEAARRARFSTKHRRQISAVGYRARRGEKLLRLLKIITFIGIVAVPSVLAAIYFLFIASDQYSSEARFTVRGGMPPKLDGIGALTGAPSMLIIQDTQVVINYIHSRAIVEALEKSVDLRTMYSSDSIDYLSRLKHNAKIEKFVRYWKGQIDTSIVMPAGIVVLTVRAFTPEDAARIADAALDASELLVNQMNDQMIKDTLALSEQERRRAESNLARARAELEKARNEEGTLNAERSAETVNGLIASVRLQLSTMQQEYDTQRRYVNENAPQIRNLEARIGAANTEINALQARLTQDPGAEVTKTIAGSMSRLDYLALENTIAEKMYATSLALLEHARLASETKLMYLNTFVHPVPAEESRYPRRLLDVMLFVAAALAAWGVVVGVIIVVKKKMA